MNKLVSIIENDDLNNFIKHFKIEKWKEPISKIENYSLSMNHDGTKSYDDADCIKYALHCNADKIFNYLLPLVDTDKHSGSNYGFPLLAMAFKKNRYDYASQIVNHSNFNPYPLYHMNSFKYIETRADPDKHIEVLFDYIKKLDTYSFYSDQISRLLHLICYSEEVFNRFDKIYQEKMNKNISVLNVLKDEINIKEFGDEIFNRKYKKFLVEQLEKKDIESLLKSAKSDNIYFYGLFESENAKDGLQALSKSQSLLEGWFKDNEYALKELPLDCIIFLEEKGYDLWKLNNNQTSAMHILLNDDDIENEVIKYLMDKYFKKIYENFKNKNKNENVLIYCHKKILENTLEVKTKENVVIKSKI